MARFRFELQPVLEHRERIEQERQRAVAELESQRVRLEGVIRQCQQGLLDERDATRALLAASDIRSVRYQVAAASRLHTTAQRAALELAGILKRFEAARASLLEASKSKKAVELLKERRFEEWKHLQNRREAEAIDELAVMRAARGGEQP